MVTVVIVPADEEVPITKQDLDGSLASYQAIVGGWIEAVTVNEQVTFYVNEEGKLMGLPINGRATEYLYELDDAWIGHDVIVGDAVIVGPPDEEGDTQSVTAEVIEYFEL